MAFAQDYVPIRYDPEAPYPFRDPPLGPAHNGPPFTMPKLEKDVQNFLLHLGARASSLYEYSFSRGFMRGLGVVYTPDEADAMIAGNTPPTETWRLNVFPVRELNGWSIVIGHRDVYHMVCTNAGIKRGARLAALLTPRNPMLPAQPQLIIRRSSDTEASASWPSGLYTLMYLQALYQLADVYRLRGLQVDINHEFVIKGPPVWMQAADAHLTHFISVLHKYMWDQGRDDAHKRRPPL